jgi:hypothetical protein
MEWIWTVSYTDVSSLQTCFFKLYKKLSLLVPDSRGWSGSGLLRTQTSVAYKCAFLKCIKKLGSLLFPVPTVEDDADVSTETGDAARLPAQVAGRRRLILETGKFCAEENKILF